MNRNRKVLNATFASIFSMFCWGCTVEQAGPVSGSGNTEARPADDVGDSRIQVDGSSTVSKVTAAVREKFEETFPGIKVALKVTGTGTGFKEMIAGRIDVANASRPVKESEQADCEKNGIELLELSVALDGLTVCVHSSNDWCDAITVAQLKTIWQPGSTVKTWKDVNPEWPDIPLVLFGAGEESGTFDYFTEVINGKEDAMTENYSPSADDNVTVTGVSGEKGGMGFFGCAYYFANEDKLKALKISATDDLADAVAPSTESVKSGKYTPLSRPLYIYVKKSSLARQEVQDFVRFYLNEGSSQAERVGYVALSEEQLNNSRAAFEAAVKK